AGRAAATLRDPAPARDGEKLAASRRSLDELSSRLLARAEKEADAGAQIVLWSEVNALILDSDEPAFLEAAGAICRRKNIYLVMGVGLLHLGERLLKNQLLIIDPLGRVAARYQKSFLAPGEPSVPGDGKLRRIDSPFGALSGAICADLSAHRL